MNWTLNDQTFELTDDNLVGFVYKITNIENGMFYVGKKIFKNTNKVKLTEKEKLTSNSRKTFKIVVKESNWKSYYGSCKELLEDIKTLGKDKFKREILQLCTSKKQMTYYETELQFKLEVLRNSTYNANILGKFFRKDL